MREVSTQWRHSSSASDVNHLALGGLDVEIAKWPDCRNCVPRFQVEDIARADTRRAVLSRRRHRDANIEANRRFRFLIAGKRVIVSSPCLRIARHQIEE